MFKNVQELQDFLTWAKTQQITKVEVGDVKVEFSPLAYIPTDAQLDEISNGSASTLADMEPSTKKEEDDLLYWSANS